MDQSKVEENESLSSVTNKLESLGRITVPIAIANMPNGNCINLSETYNQLGLPVGNSDANIVSISIFI